MSPPPPRPRAGAPTDYSSKDYWTSRFEREPTFEWLTPSSVLSPHITHALADLDAGLQQILHIGCGNSELSLELRQLVQTQERPTRAENVEIVNVDYAAPALDRMRATEIARFGNSCMRWEVLDLLDWTVTSRVLSEPRCTVIVDKSCADAIACGQDVETPLLVDGSTRAHPMEVLALHLAAVTTPGSIWLAVSYSTTRFDVISSNEGAQPRAGDYWHLERTERIVAQSEPQGHVHTPDVYHTLFVLKRTDRTL